MKRFAFAIAAVFIFSAPASAQSANQSTPSAYAAGTWQQNAVIGIQNKTANIDFSPRAAYQGGANKGQPIALMAVGGAAIVLGALMDNDARGLLMVGGTVVGLYGLYLYLR